VPELPEVETMAADVRPHLAGARIRAARVFKPGILRKVSRPAFERAVSGRRVTAVGRRAKHVVLELDDGQRVVVHPRMTGSLQVSGKRGAGSGERDPYDVLHLVLESGRTIRFRDVRRLGVVLLLSPTQWARYEAGIGPEPLDRAFTADVLASIARSTRAAVKKVIMDQRRLAGVGNIYASEALWLASIDPSRPASSLTPEEVRALHRAIVDVLRRAVRGRGTTVRDYRTGTGQPGTFQGRLHAYDRAGEPCHRCGTRLTLTHAIDGRSTYLCHWCQH
jgi:formamidopyrimidine-DNA glycosylase